MLGNNLLKNNLIFLFILKLIFIFGEKNFFANKNKIINWINPAIDTP